MDSGARHGDARAEFLRLDMRAAGEGLAGNASRQAEIVLDLRRGTRLPARRQRFEHDGLQALGRSIDGGGEPRRPRPRHVVDDIQIRRLGDAQSRGPPRSAKAVSFRRRRPFFPPKRGSETAAKLILCLDAPLRPVAPSDRTNAATAGAAISDTGRAPIPVRRNALRHAMASADRRGWRGRSR